MPIPGSPVTNTPRRRPSDASLQARRSAASCASRPANVGGAVDRERGGERDGTVRLTAQRTRHACTGCARPGSDSSPASSSASRAAVPASRRTVSATRICPGAGGGAEPLSLDDRRSEDVVVLPGHVARADAHAHRERDRAAVRLPVDRPLDVPGAGDRGPGRLENGQEAVAERLDLLAAVHGDHVPQPAIVLAAHRVGILVAQLASHPRGAGEIGEQDRRRRTTALRPRRLHAGRRTVPQRRILGQNRPLEPLELGPRAQPKLRVERPHRLPVGIERVALPPCPIESEHELPAQPLPQRVARHQGLELGHQLAVTSGQEIRLDAILERRRVQPLQPHHLGLRERLEREPGERRAAPLRKRGAQATRGALGQPRGERPPPLVAQRLETLQVQLTAAPDAAGSRAGSSRAGARRLRAPGEAATPPPEAP